MKTYRISKKTNQVISMAAIDFEQIVTSGNDLCLIVNEEQAAGINEGGKLHFEKFASGNTGELIKVCEDDSVVRKIVTEDGMAYIYFDYLYIQPLEMSVVFGISTQEDYKYKITFSSPHNMLPSDVDENYKVYVIRGNDIIAYNGIAFCYPSSIVRGKDIDITGSECCTGSVTLFNYETMDRYSILAETVEVVAGESFTPTSGDRVMFATNPYFYTDEDGSVVLYPPYEYLGGEQVTVSKYTDFMNLDVALDEDYDAKRMFQEYQVNDLFVKKIKNEIIPDFIDLEKIKYAPSFDSGDETLLATGLTFNFHFRTRIPKSSIDRYSFDDTWHFNDATDTWNGNGVKDLKKKEDLYKDEDFVNSSNLIGFLGFTDNDIYNQKNRVSQTFIRLSFYDSDNPLTQNLLCYSTMFLDSGELYGKYVKRKAWLVETHGEEYVEEVPVVWSVTGKSDPCEAITCQITVNDEFDMTKSGEGFNLYLFKQDAPLENEQQDIYMKVEFNHAGYGRTVPMIYWRKDETGEPVSLSIENYMKNLYIPVRISLSDNGYVYSFPDAVSSDDENAGGRCNGIVWENERLVLNLFEPMLDTIINIQE